MSDTDRILQAISELKADIAKLDKLVYRLTPKALQDSAPLPETITYGEWRDGMTRQLDQWEAASPQSSPLQEADEGG